MRTDDVDFESPELDKLQSKLNDAVENSLDKAFQKISDALDAAVMKGKAATVLTFEKWLKEEKTWTATTKQPGIVSVQIGNTDIVFQVDLRGLFDNYEPNDEARAWLKWAKAWIAKLEADIDETQR